MSNGINQNVEITVIRILAVQDGTKDTGITRVVILNNAPDGIPMQLKGF